ncbi:3',5'-cyclic-nucleotide phosphodiesterase [Desulfolutivibrio sulfoxidireducens]|uniref:3',5'-cyclic-nucleotide phosphodiesterase n=1 Tax=Desulfolutivibrio sulfoxidireducens TaxID=2773299 RepID=UPI00159D82C5|nr:3',5'-cyclic-nucleotide phosphodiesterase [Desulfolutivibrio sulfoxidireducens]QLA17073.1 MBL fold metallo-hydrolase [Desulfolutivibrio sulfoxidireducens]QLA20641.1 MBL fold metallo-hydrolase [Desulfolutivibrio sulfoxidireducens]
MLLRVLGCSGSDLPGHHLTSFLVDEAILLDAGSVTSALDLSQQSKITDIFVTHAHLDHIKDILFLADNLIEFFSGKDRPPVRIHGLADVLGSIAEHLLNDTIWPDFTVIPENAPVLAYHPLAPETVIQVRGLNVATCPVNHARAASGFVLWSDDGEHNVAYTGDTGPNGRWWDFLNALPFPLTNLITEASFPNSMETLARTSKHLTPGLLRVELERLTVRPKVHIYHMKSPFSAQIQEELQRDLAGYTYHLMNEKETFSF